MKAQTTLRKIMDNSFRPCLKKIMEKWPEAKDAHAFVKIARAIDEETKDYLDTLRALSKQNGYSFSGSEKTVDSQEITDKLLQEFGKFSAEGQLTLSAASPGERSQFMVEKNKADVIIKAFNTSIEELLDKDFYLEIPRKIKVLDKYLRKEVLSVQDCFILEPVLDLSAMTCEEDIAEEKSVEEE